MPMILSLVLAEAIILEELPMSKEELTKEQYQEKIAELEQQLETAQKENNFDEIKNRYETIIEEKNQEIEKQKQELKNKTTKIDKTVQDLNDEVEARLKESEACKELQTNLAEMERERAEATVDAYIQKGIILPKQRESAINICLKDNENFLNLYRDAKPIVETEKKRKSVPTGTAERIANYLKI